MALDAGGTVEAELGGHDDLIAAPGDGPPDEGLVVPVVAVAVGGVDEGGAGVEGVGQGAERPVVVDLAVHPRRQDHRAEANGGDLAGAEATGGEGGGGAGHGATIRRP